MSRHIVLCVFIITLLCLFSTLYTVENSQHTLESFQNITDFSHFNGDSLDFPTSPPAPTPNNKCCNTNRDIIYIENAVPYPVVEKEIIYQCPSEMEEEESHVTCEVKCTIPTKCPQSEGEESDGQDCRKPVPHPPHTPKPTPPPTPIPMGTCPPQTPVKRVYIKNFPTPEPYCDNDSDDGDCDA